MGIIEIMDNNYGKNGTGLKVKYLILCLMESNRTYNIADPIAEFENKCSEEIKAAIGALEPHQLEKCDFIAQDSWNLSGVTRDDVIDHFIGEMEEDEDDQLKELAKLIDLELLN